MISLFHVSKWHALPKILMTSWVVISFSIVPYSSIYAQESGAGDADAGSSGAEDTGRISFGVTGANTKSFVKDITNANSTCLIIPLEYRADCLAQNLKEAGRKVRKKTYAPVKAELQIAAQAIDQIIIENLDEAAPLIKVGNKTYRPVKKEAVEQVNQQVTKVLEDTASKLIRAAGKSVTRKIHFQRIAKAVDSNKVLLRAA